MTARRIAQIAGMIYVFALSGSAFAGNIEEGIAAYNRAYYATAVSKFRKAAEQGDATAQHNLGLMYAEGQGVAKDYKQALYWTLEAAKQGFAAAQNNLGWMFYIGGGVSKDDERAVYWYLKAVEQGNAQAQLNLGWMYESGQGVEEDYVQAYVRYSLAAAQGHDDGRKYRDKLEQHMRSEHIAKARRLTRE